MPLKRAAAKPADTATMSNTTSSTNTLTSEPKKRGRTRYWRGSIPIASRARTSPRTRLVASSAAIAVPERPATVRAVMSGPSSRTIATTMSVPMKSVAPSWASSRTAWEITRKDRMPDSRTTSPMASVAVKRIWLRVTRRATARPAAGRVPRERRAPKPKRASAPRRESRRAVEPPIRLSGSVTASARRLPLQHYLRLGEVGEGVDGAWEQLTRAGMVAAVVIQQRPRVVGKGFGRHLAAHPLLGRLPGQCGEVRNVLEQRGRNRLDDVEHVVSLHLRRFGLHDFAGLHVDQSNIDAEIAVEVNEVSQDVVARPDQLADLRARRLVYPAVVGQILLVDQLLNPLALHDPCGWGRAELRYEHARHAALQRFKVFLPLTVGATVVERQHGDSRPGILAARLPGRSAHQGEGQHHRRAYRCYSPTHIRSSSESQVHAFLRRQHFGGSTALLGLLAGGRQQLIQLLVVVLGPVGGQ